MLFRSGLAQQSGNLMLRSMVSDIADKHRLETGQETSGLLYSVFSMTTKAATAVAVGIALPLVGWLGLKLGSPNTDEFLFYLKLVFALGPALAHLLSAVLLIGFSLDRARHDEIRAALALSPDQAPTPLKTKPSQRPDSIVAQTA